MQLLVKKLEHIGQTASLKQFSTVNEMVAFGNQSADMIDEAFSHSKELYCLIEPEDDED